MRTWSWWTMALFMIMGWFHSNTAPAAPEVRPALPVVLASDEQAVPVAFLVLNHGEQPAQWRVTLEFDGGRVEPSSVEVSVPARAWQVVTARVQLSPERDSALVRARVGQQEARITVRRGIDLTLLEWRRRYAPREAPPDPALAAPDLDDSAWERFGVPTLWQDLRYAWCRVRFTVPEAWRGKPLRLFVAAIDDNDITYLNGQQIGRTNGWDLPRDYPLPESAVRYGAENVLTVMVENTYAGGGLYRAPLAILVGEEPIPLTEAPTAAAPARPQPAPIGEPLPLRPMMVRDGVLYYADGGEVALWGVNYYPQSWHQFVNMKRLGVDMKAAIRQDLDHLQQMGVQIIRIHVFDREITDREGNLIDNEHLDLLDYLVAECSRRGVYMMFTPIAWWGGPNERPDSFSANTSKPGMMFVPEAKRAAANYLRQFLQHVNRYTRRAYKDEPCLVLLEVMNEPAYFVYQDLFTRSYTPQGERPEVIERDRATFRQLWQQWCVQKGLSESPAYFPLFRYELMRQYIREMMEAIRSTGAKQPVAIAFFGGADREITQAIGDSECEAITVPADYPGGWERVNDGINLLPQAAPMDLPAAFARKARLQYEFDTPATNTSCYLYPALAARLRSGEVQVACQFQYDSFTTARWNTDWQAHWLNWLYTPSKTVSFMLAGETFRRLPRGVRYSRPATELIMPNLMATSFSRNQSLLATDEVVMYARGIDDWQPLRLPASPRRIVGTGSSPYVDYTGSGLYILQQEDENTLSLRLNPDAVLIGNSLYGSFAAPVAELREQPHLFRLKMDGWREAQCFPRNSTQPLPKVRDGWLLLPGEYTIRRGR
ncbi:MAG: beta galactosidase jelly roll domain-containing protein [Armatimonadota bacterium]|nr:beta galactosidase jelly roll domain-containing protein [Armatimonadota bacterium]